MQEPIPDSLKRAYLESKNNEGSIRIMELVAQQRSVVIQIRHRSGHVNNPFRNPSLVTLSMGWPAGLA